MSKAKTDNSFFKQKVELRLDVLNIKKSPIMVLDCFAGQNKLWDNIKLKSKKNIKVISIDHQKKSNKNIIADNIKMLKGLDLTKFQIIDLDAYGIPFRQLKIIFSKKYKGIIVMTYIQTMYGCLPKQLLHNLGYSDKMLKKIPTLFLKNGRDKIFEWLAKKGVKKVTGFFIKRKSYFYFSTN